MSKQLLHSSHTKLHTTQWFTNHSNSNDTQIPNYTKVTTQLSQPTVSNRLTTYSLPTKTNSQHLQSCTWRTATQAELVQLAFFSHTTPACLSHN